MNRRDLTRSVIALPAGFVALHALPVAAAPVLAGPAARTPPADAAQSVDRAAISTPDAELLSLCRRYQSIERRQGLLFDQECLAQEAGDKDLERWLGAVQRRYVPYLHRLMAEIVDAKPQTQAGLQAKARVFIQWMPRDLDGSPAGEFGPLWSLCRDLLGHDPEEGTA